MALDDKVAMRLGGCTQLVRGDHGLITAAIICLRTCDDHVGQHHFAVIGDGEALACSELAVRCLRDQGIEI